MTPRPCLFASILFFSLQVCRDDPRYDPDIHTPVEFEDSLKTIAEIKDEL